MSQVAAINCKPCYAIAMIGNDASIFRFVQCAFQSHRDSSHMANRQCWLLDVCSCYRTEWLAIQSWDRWDTSKSQIIRWQTRIEMDEAQMPLIVGSQNQLFVYLVHVLLCNWNILIWCCPVQFNRHAFRETGDHCLITWQLQQSTIKVVWSSLLNRIVGLNSCDVYCQELRSTTLNCSGH